MTVIQGTSPGSHPVYLDVGQTVSASATGDNAAIEIYDMDDVLVASGTTDVEWTAEYRGFHLLVVTAFTSTISVVDDFERADIGSDWVTSGGTWSISSGNLRKTNTGTDSIRHTPTGEVADQRVMVHKPSDADYVTRAGAMMRIQGTDCTGYAALWQLASGEQLVQLCRYNDDAKTVLGSFNGDQTYGVPTAFETVTVECDGTTVRAYALIKNQTTGAVLNDGETPIIEVTDATYTTGYTGVVMDSNVSKIGAFSVGSVVPSDYELTYTVGDVPPTRILPDKVRHIWLVSNEGKTILRNRT